jgi:hypothetical protein
LKGVSQNTVHWYRDSFHAYQGATDSNQVIVQRIAELMDRGVEPISINTYLRCVNAYLRCLHLEPRCERYKGVRAVKDILGKETIGTGRLKPYPHLTVEHLCPVENGTIFSARLTVLVNDPMVMGTLTKSKIGGFTGPTPTAR